MHFARRDATPVSAAPRVFHAVRVCLRVRAKNRDLVCFPTHEKCTVAVYCCESVSACRFTMLPNVSPILILRLFYNKVKKTFRMQHSQTKTSQRLFQKSYPTVVFHFPCLNVIVSSSTRFYPWFYPLRRLSPFLKRFSFSRKARGISFRV